MKQKQYLIKIEKPCKEAWNDMTDTENGKHCLRCEKNVIDFTALSNEQIIDLINRERGKVCGRFYAQQLEKPLSVMTSAPTRPRARFYALFATVLLINANTSYASVHKPFQTEKFCTLKLHPSQPLQATKTDSLKPRLKGKIMDEKSKESLPFASVAIKGTKINTVADADGLFSLNVPDTLADKKIILLINYVGYNSKELIVKKVDLFSGKMLKVKLTPFVILFGDVIIIKEDE